MMMLMVLDGLNRMNPVGIPLVGILIMVRWYPNGILTQSGYPQGASLQCIILQAI
ncbi:hypothetical protein [Bacteroides sp. 519]|uniref:hypothetical protein n=1 Tax=Bacteroides sp. 519 TaxID=2302937 RepID=UPI0019402778|nr:hypothetical protein [Bacteroides sp. 519]